MHGCFVNVRTVSQKVCVCFAVLWGCLCACSMCVGECFAFQIITSEFDFRDVYEYN